MHNGCIHTTISDELEMVNSFFKGRYSVPFKEAVTFKEALASLGPIILDNFCPIPYFLFLGKAVRRQWYCSSKGSWMIGPLDDWTPATYGTEIALVTLLGHLCQSRRGIVHLSWLFLTSAGFSTIDHGVLGLCI